MIDTKWLTTGLLISLCACSGRSTLGAGDEIQNELGSNAEQSGSPNGGEGASNETCDFGSVTFVELSELPKVDQPEEECQIIGARIEAERAAVVDLDVAPLAGVWRDGEGADAVELMIDRTGNGTLRYGETIELPAIEDPDVGYLDEQFGEPGLGSQVSVLAGFTYSLYPTSGRASEMAVDLRLGEPWAEWCALQAPVRGSAHCYTCDESAGYGFAAITEACGGETGQCYASVSENGERLAAPVDCERLRACNSVGSVCGCTAESCQTSTELLTHRTISLDPVDPTVIRVENIWGSEMRYLARAESTQ